MVLGAQSGLQVAPDAEEHLEFVAIGRELLLGDAAFGVVDQLRIVRGDGGEEGPGEQAVEQPRDWSAGGRINLTELRQIHRLVVGPVWVHSPPDDLYPREGPGSFRPDDIRPLSGGTTPPALPDRPRPRRLRDAGIRFAGRLLDAAGIAPQVDRRRGLERLCQSLGTLGFNARIESVDAEKAVLVSPTCPLRPIVVAHPEAAQLDRAMWCGLAAGAARRPALGYKSSDFRPSWRSI